MVATIPFGMNPEGMTAWYYQGEGLRLWEDIRRLQPGAATRTRVCAADGRMVPEEEDQQQPGPQDRREGGRHSGAPTGR